MLLHSTVALETTMLLTVNPNDGLPIYRQIATQVKHAVASGALQQGEKLPSQRELAAELVVSHLTVKKAYETLEAEGIIATERGRGTFVSGDVPDDLKVRGMRDLGARAEGLADAARLLGLDRRAFTRLCTEAWREAAGKTSREDTR
jgi:GntR family transcriptional regulator